MNEEINKELEKSCFCGGDFKVIKIKGNKFEAQCNKCLDEGITNIIKGTIKKKDK